jgi:hypothetical protein
MKPFREPSPVCKAASRLSHRSSGKKLAVAVALTSLLSCNLLTLTGCKGQNTPVGPSNGEIAGIIIGAAVVVGGTTAILIHAKHSFHQVQGCVSSGPNGLEVQTDNKQTWLLAGYTPDIQVGEQVKLKGLKVKRPKHSPGNPTFQVGEIMKDYGPCKADPAATTK